MGTGASYTFTPLASGDYTANFSAGLVGVHFNFDSGIPLLPLHTAQPTIETEASAGYVLSKFAAHFIAPSADSDSPGNWVPSAAPVTLSGSNNQVIVTPSNARRFFRLKHP